MARITSHQVPGARSNGSIEQTSRDLYLLDIGGGKTLEVKFHSGPISGGLNGVTMEQLLQLVFTRAEAMKAEVFDGRTGGAQLHIFRALSQLKARTADRLAGGVEGIKQPTPGPTGRA